MSTRITNIIRFIIDECIPPILRDNRFFMYPFFYIWFNRKNIKTYMDFKSLAYQLSEEEFEAVYRNMNCLSKNRETDTNRNAISYILSNLDSTGKTLIDIGCGRGYFLKRALDLGKYQLTGCDFAESITIEGVQYQKANIEKLPFPDKSFDIVTCQHMLEHVRDLGKAVEELKRITRKQLIVVLPRQKYFYYTLDLHLHFFPIQAHVEQLMGLKDSHCIRIGQDWVYIATFHPVTA